MPNHTALLIIDAQVNMFGDKMCVYNDNLLLETIGALARRARLENIPVIYIRNNGGAGEPDEPGTPGWEIHPKLRPQAGDVVIDKRGPDSFATTGLEKELQSRGIKHLVLTGMQTEVCIDAASRKAVALGYQVTVVADGHSTFDFEEMKAEQAIAEYNAAWAKIAHIKQAAEIKFG